MLNGTASPSHCVDLFVCAPLHCSLLCIICLHLHHRHALDSQLLHARSIEPSRSRCVVLCVCSFLRGGHSDKRGQQRAILPVKRKRHAHIRNSSDNS